MQIKIRGHGIKYFTGGKQLNCPECNSNQVDVQPETVWVGRVGRKMTDSTLICECISCKCAFEVTKAEDEKDWPQDNLLEPY